MCVSGVSWACPGCDLPCARYSGWSVPRLLGKCVSLVGDSANLVLKETVTTTARKPSTGSGPAAHLRSSLRFGAWWTGVPGARLARVSRSQSTRRQALLSPVRFAHEDSRFSTAGPALPHPRERSECGPERRGVPSLSVGRAMNGSHGWRREQTRSLRARSAPGRAVAEGSVSRRGRGATGEEWGVKRERVPSRERAEGFRGTGQRRQFRVATDGRRPRATVLRSSDERG